MFSILCYTIIGLIAAFVIAVIAGVAKQTPEQRAQIYEQHLQSRKKQAKTRKATATPQILHERTIQKRPQRPRAQLATIKALTTDRVSFDTQ